MINNQEGMITHNGLKRNEGSWIECQHYLVRKKYTPGSTFIDLDELGRSTRDLEEDFKQCGGLEKKAQFIVLNL